MTSEWKYWKSSKFEGYCSKCERPVPKEEPRWNRKGDNGFYEILCQDCAPKPGQESKPPQSREDAIAAAHTENMQSAKETRNMMALLVTAINGLTEAVKNHGK